MQLDYSDIQRLASEPSPTVRADIARKVCQGYHEQRYTERQQSLAEDIITLLVRDTSRRVRQALAEELQHNQTIDKAVILALVGDHEEVAIPLLQHSPLLEDEDLIAVIEATRQLGRLLAIARRDSLSDTLCQHLIGTGEHEVTRQVIDNSAAQLHEDTYSYLLEEYAQDESILEALVTRAGLPYGVAERLFAQVSDRLKVQLTRRFRLPKMLIDEATTSAREASVIRFLSPWMSQQDITQLVKDMHQNKRLSDSVILRSLCVGDLRFFQTALARRSHIALQNVKLLLADVKGFNACYEAANMPETYRDAAHILYQVALEETHYGHYFHQQFATRVVMRIREHQGWQQLPQMDYLLGLVGQAAHDLTIQH